MPDMLVSLLDLPSLEPILSDLRAQHIIVRRAFPFEITPTRTFIQKHFGTGWADEVSVGFANKPVSVYLALEEEGEHRRIVGFSAYECTCRNFFGPTGVAESHRKRGIGRALLIAALHGLRELGYAYGIIGGAGPGAFYSKSAGAIPIEGSVPGIYRDMLSGAD